MASNECFYQYVVIPLLPKDTEKDVPAIKEEPCDDTGVALPAACAGAMLSGKANSPNDTTEHPLKDCEMPDLKIYEDQVSIPAAAASSVFHSSQASALNLNEYVLQQNVLTPSRTDPTYELYMNHPTKTDREDSVAKSNNTPPSPIPLPSNEIVRSLARYLRTPSTPISLGEGLIQSNLSQLWVGEQDIFLHEKDLYRWVSWKDPSGIVRTKQWTKNDAVANFRAERWSNPISRAMAFSFAKGDAHKPWERERFTDVLSGQSDILESVGMDIFEKTHFRVSEVEDDSQKAKTKMVWGTTMNRKFTLLRLETIEALKAYSQANYDEFMRLIEVHKDIITAELCSVFNRGPIFSPGMVAMALRNLLKNPDSVETNTYVKHIIHHYLVNCELYVGTSLFGRKKWRIPSITIDNLNLFSETPCDLLLDECREFVYGAGDLTMDQRRKLAEMLSRICLTATYTRKLILRRKLSFPIY